MKQNSFIFSTSVIAWPLFFVLALWIVFWVEVRFKIDLSSYGILPRTVNGLKGIILSPFLHGDIKHLYNNSIPLLFLIAVLRYFYREVSLQVLVFGILFSGIGTWMIGRESYHIGASGLIYVLVSFIFFKGIQTQYYRLVALSLVIVMLYGGMVWYIFPEVENGISWEGHLAGFITGFLFSLLYKAEKYKKPIRYEWEKPDFNPENDPFMKHFDEQGNFVNTPKPEELEVDYSFFKIDENVFYEFKPENEKE
ncbi:rhomboid family intramembrane serine protease [Flavobacterium piscinae]|uniref:Rhomboid family intramembrane serine protease n=1 Tax=Flavobacterium piscinae TaxID=2506424 RepID=A0A4Q1KWV7_9FLAO|nr:rhomboid family intramembrane serine protease [Flavobacterium piscinae]RXR34722.1 rhomboid family intramembrane serine protease [Flavobacterium piscinae]